MTISIWLPLVCFCAALAVFVGLFICFRLRGNFQLALCFKTLASLMFVGGGIYAGFAVYSSPLSALVVVGLVLAMLGDIALELKLKEQGKFFLNCGFALFSASSLMFIIYTAAVSLPLSRFWFVFGGAAIVSLLVAAVVLLAEKPLKLNLDKVRVQVAIYSCLVAMAAALGLAVSLFVTGYFVFSVGALLVLVSDVLLSFCYFKEPKHPKTLVVANHVLYYAGELMIMIYLFLQVL